MARGSEMDDQPCYDLTKVEPQSPVPAVVYPGEWEPDEIVPPSEGGSQD